MSETLWEDPPVARRASTRHVMDELKPLLDHPGRTARLGERDSASEAEKLANRFRSVRADVVSQAGRTGRIAIKVREAEGKYRVYGSFTEERVELDTDG